jgi:HEAT repeat protein
MSPIRQLPLALTLLLLLAGPAAAQYNPNRVGRHGNPGSSASIDDLAKQLASSDADTRLQAVKALGASKDNRAVEYLIKSLGDSDVRVQAKAVQSLGDLRATEATLVLVEYLLRRTTDAHLKQPILVSLGEIGDMRAAQPLIEFLQRDTDVTTRGTAVFALGEIGAPESAHTLQHIAETDADETVRRLASEAARKVEGHRAVNDDQTNEQPGAPFKPRASP